MMKILLIPCIVCVSWFSQAQQYDSFEIENGELIWRYTYNYQGPEDSLRSEIVSMIKSKLFTRHVQRTQVGSSGAGYTGEIEHYKVDCEAYGRKYQNTPLIYWKGEWKGKFVVEVRDDGYRITVYGLYFEVRTQASTPHQKSNTRKGPYIKEVWKKGDSTFKSNVLDDMTLMSVALRDAFDIKKYTSPVVDWQN
ncbi:MAG: hypothetical protein IPK96_00105 [Flammeovirgaceae bacterium]|jgi:hypothetical protein|nr:hypothetical protein [Flammeovirgaceae bacterium]